MIQSTSNVSLEAKANLLTQEPQSPGEKQVKKESHFHEDLVGHFFIRSFIYSFVLKPRFALGLAGFQAAASLIDHHGESISKVLSELGAASKSTGAWIGNRIDQALLGGAQEEAAVKVEDVKNQIFNK